MVYVTVLESVIRFRNDIKNVGRFKILQTQISSNIKLCFKTNSQVNCIVDNELASVLVVLMLLISVKTYIKIYVYFSMAKTSLTCYCAACYILFWPVVSVQQDHGDARAERN